MRKLIAINPNGNAIGLDSTLVFPFKTTALPRGIYVYTLTHDVEDGDSAYFASVPYINRELHRTTYQLPMPEFGV